MNLWDSVKAVKLKKITLGYMNYPMSQKQKNYLT